jgi:hypothetical protein
MTQKGGKAANPAPAAKPTVTEATSKSAPVAAASGSGEFAVSGTTAG